jgi:predicted transcriptional regulator
VTAREEAGRSAFQRIVDTVFGGSAEAMLLHFVSDRRLTRAELERIRTALDDRLESKSATAREKGE